MFIKDEVGKLTKGQIYHLICLNKLPDYCSLLLQHACIFLKANFQTKTSVSLLIGLYHVVERKQPPSHSLNTGVSGKHGFHSSKVILRPRQKQQGFEDTSSHMPGSLSWIYKGPKGSWPHPHLCFSKAGWEKVNLEALNHLTAQILQSEKQ